MTDSEPQHSRVCAPSAAHRWMHCTASSTVIQHFPDGAGAAAMEGTAAHLILERCLTEGSEAKHFLGRTVRVTEGRVAREFIVDDEMVAHVDVGVALFRGVALRPGVSRVEAPVHLTHLHPELFGRCDVYHFDQDVLTVGDFKYGRVDVSPVQNPQEMLYALGVYYNCAPQAHSVKKVRLIIYQPRSLAAGSRVKEWTCEIGDLLNFELEVKVALNEMRLQPTFRHGEWCKYCPALGGCPETQTLARQVAPVLLASEIGPREAALILTLKNLFESKVKAAQAVAFEELTHGRAVAGFWLGTSKKHRQWKDEEAAAEALATAYSVRVLRPPTPAQAEKLGTEAHDIVTRLAFTPPGEPIVVPEGSSAAPYVVKSLEQIFGG